LIQHTLINSYHEFVRQKKPYPLVDPHSLRPGSASPSKEFYLHHAALVVLLNGQLSDKLRHHFRCRGGNRLRMRNLVDVAPDLSYLKSYRPQQRYSTHPHFERLIQQLLPLDFALLVQQSLDQERHGLAYELSHFHVKIEGILDNALRSMGIYLNYLKEDLYERGDSYVDLLEKKFYEYFNFYHNSAGRRTAAVLAAQLLAQEGQEGTVYVSSQQDRRLTLFSSGPSTTSALRKTDVEHFTLLALSSSTTKKLKEWGQEVGLNIGRDYLISKKSKEKIFILHTQFEQTPAASPSLDGQLRSKINRQKKWVRLVKEQIISINPSCRDVIHFPCVYQKGVDWKKIRKISPWD
jgi:hypothetical protein